MRVAYVNGLLSLLLGLALITEPCHSASKKRRSAVAEDYIGIVANVNNQIITHKDLEEFMNLMELLTNARGGQRRNIQLEREALRELTNQYLKDQHLEKFAKFMKKEWVSDQEVSEAFADVAKRMDTTPKSLERLLASRKIKKETLLKKIRVDFGWEAYVGARYRKDVKISDKEADRTAEEVKKKIVGEAFLVSKMFFPITTPSTESVVAARVNNVVQLLNRGANFSNVARQFANASNGGELGWVFDGQLSKAEMDVLRKMPVGSRKVVKTDRGYSVLLLREKKEAGPRTYSDIKFKQVVYPYEKKPRDNVLKELLDYTAELKKASADCYDFMKKAKDSGVMVVSDEFSGTLEAMVDEYRKIIAKVQVGGISTPIVTDNGIIFVCLIGKKTKKINPPSANDIKNQKISERLTSLAERELRMLVNKASIRINHKYSADGSYFGIGR